jgi:hypothetical protein
MGRDTKSIVIMMLITMLWITAVAAVQENPTIICQKGLLSVTAQNVKPEALFTALGKQCAIEVVTHGDVFPAEGATVSFENLPVKEGVKKLVKACGLKNYLIDFQGDAPENKKIAKLELFIGGTGAKVLTKAAEQEQKPGKPGAEPEKSASQQMKDLRESGQMQDKKSFAEGTDVKWDGSALLDFPEYEGKLDYEKSKYSWNDEAKDFSSKTMNTVPPAVRDVVAEYIIKECNEIAQERNASVITQGIAAEALQRIAKNSNMPPMVMRNLPKNTDDLNKPRIPVNAGDLKPEYQK